MTTNSVVILGISLDDFPEMEEALALKEDHVLVNALYDANIMAFGIDGEYWAIGTIIQSNEEEYVNEINIQNLKDYKSKRKGFLKQLHEIDSEFFAQVKLKHIKIYHTIETN